jgi:hypothetical protein
MGVANRRFLSGVLHVPQKIADGPINMALLKKKMTTPMN